MSCQHRQQSKALEVMIRDLFTHVIVQGVSSPSARLQNKACLHGDLALRQGAPHQRPTLLQLP